MRSTCVQAAAWMSSFLVAIGLLVGPARTEQPTRQVERLPLEDAHFSSPVYEFKRSQDGTNWNLSYRIKGHTGDWKTCSVRMLTGNQVHDSYGYSKEERSQEVAEYLRSVINDRMKKDGMRLYYGKLTVTYIPDKKQYSIGWNRIDNRLFISQGKLESDQREDAAKEERQFIQWWNSEKDDLLKEADKKFMEERGFLFSDEKKWVANYPLILDRSAPVIQSCIDVIKQETGGDPEILMRFFQSMPYVNLTDREADTGRMIWGLLVPSSVLIMNEGDCDSKSLAYCAIQRKTSSRLIILRSFRPKGNKSPAHALVGVDASSRSGPGMQGGSETSTWQKVWLEAIFDRNQILFDNHYYTPCEVAKPGWLFGEVASRKDDYYLIIPIQPVAGTSESGASGRQNGGLQR
jgi:hypothetical protein